MIDTSDSVNPKKGVNPTSVAKAIKNSQHIGHKKVNVKEMMQMCRNNKAITGKPSNNDENTVTLPNKEDIVGKHNTVHKYEIMGKSSGNMQNIAQKVDIMDKPSSNTQNTSKNSSIRTL